MIETDVLIVGLRPGRRDAGRAAGAGGRARASPSTASEVYPLPRAAHFDHEIMRVFQQLGIAER